MQLLNFRGKNVKKGTIHVRAEELDASKDIVFIQASGRRLDKKDFFGKSDAYLEFQRCNEDGSLVFLLSL